MYFLVKTLKKFFKIFNSLAAPWQVLVGTLLGTLLGFLPVMGTSGPSPLGLTILGLAIIINCHFGSVLLFFGLGWLLTKILALAGVGVAVGNMFDSLARASADNAFLHASKWSDTGYLGLTLIGLVAAPIFAIAMWRFTIYFRSVLRDRLLARRSLVKAGKVGGNTLLLRVVCWFFDL
jgi:hypothetical protein